MRANNHGHLFSRSATCLAALLFAAALPAPADDVQTNAPAALPTPVENGDHGLPFPLHQVEGSGGVFATLSAYIVNPPRTNELFGLPSVGAAYVNLGHDQNVEALTLTESPLSRLELGYGWDRLGLGDLPQALHNVGLVNFHVNQVELHNFNLRLQLLKEGEFDQKWLPAVTAGVHYKYNNGIMDVNSQVDGLLAYAGVSRHQGVDYTLYASKLFTQLPVPILLEAGGRATTAVLDGLGGFTDRYNFVAEGNVVVFLSKHFALAAEYKQQPRDYQAIGNLFKHEGDWWTLDAAYVVNRHFSLAAGYGHFGNLLNHEANGAWGLTAKWEF